MPVDSVLKRINERYKSFSKGQKRLADFIMKNPDEAVFMTAARLGEKVGISESTAVRFAVSLGYKGFPQFRAALEEVVMNHMTSLQRMEAANNDIKRDEVLHSILLSDIDKIKATIELCDTETFRNAVKTILEARRVYIIGIRSCAPLAEFFGLYLRQIVDEVTVVSSTSINEIFEQMIRINEEDVAIGISFPRYSMRTLKAIEFANSRNARIINITDSVHSPMNLYSSCNLLAKSDMASIVDSLVAPLSLINALLVALCMEREEEVAGTLTMMEKLWDEYQVYSRDDMEPPREESRPNGRNTE
ncbi:MAG: MurR/RpiR family transcriptional regulator [Lachnospiraceae bacterium]|nr:MurR/RpiR family transcriptional regulator [Lachnospiraceae bacterium]